MGAILPAPNPNRTVYYGTMTWEEMMNPLAARYLRGFSESVALSGQISRYRGEKDRRLGWPSCENPARKENRTVNLKICTFVGVVGLLAGRTCLAAEFSADFVDVKGPKTEAGTLYMKGDKVRRDVTQGTPTIVIYRPDKNLLWTLNPADKTYFEVLGVSIVLTDADLTALKAAGSIKLVGDETINGYLCEKYASNSARNAFSYWESKKLKVVIKMQSEGAYKTLTEYKSIKEAPVPDSMFELPAGYKKVELK
jgi:hypothetical protein